ncbi:hypothetical protein QVD17_09179 [Tagetes erecta]|uniref:Reverse transcriptase n=1 Tax=Tagetes erecta TaxID=13708 RepID=A0AAD8KYW1_TARER|nr:hypothetical protein QVD17_09179 [Tagetes erecta]
MTTAIVKKTNSLLPADCRGLVHLFFCRCGLQAADIFLQKKQKAPKAFASTLYDAQIPKYVEQALGSKNWKDAMETKMKALMKSETWEICVLPPNKKSLGCRWLFSIKPKPDGTIERYKAQLVAKGYSQT